MPRVVDRDERRDSIVTAYLGLVERDGIAGATTRALARELGVAVGSLWLYFDGVEELRRVAYERTWGTANRVIREHAASPARGLEAFAHVVLAVLPVHESTPVEARLARAFLEMPGPREAVYDVQRRLEDSWRAALEQCLLQAREDGELIASTDPVVLAELVLTVTIGLQMEFVIGSTRGAAPEMWRIVSTLMAPWLREGVTLPRPWADAAPGS